MIVIENVYNAQSTTSPLTISGVTVPSSGCVLVIFEGNDTTTSSTYQINGQSVPNLTSNFTTGARYQIVYLSKPIVGTFDIVITNAGALTNGIIACAVVISGINQLSFPTTFINSSARFTPVSANSIFFSVAYGLSNPSTLTPNGSQTQIMNGANGTDLLGVSYAIVNPFNLQNGTWVSGAGSTLQGGFVLEGSKSPSIWNPNVNQRHINDVSGVNNLNFGNSVLPGRFGYYPSTFFQNSFLHTIGRMGLIYPFSFSPTPAGDNVRTTSQIIIDKIYQGEKASSIGSTVNLSMDVNIPSQDAVLVVTGGSVIATGAAWGDVNYNGTKLSKLVGATVAGADAEIWYLPNPPVGIGTLNILSGTGGEIYANAMVLLGVDKSDKNIVTVSTTDAASTSTITGEIFPDASNCLLIDCLSTLDATARPLPDTSQTQVFNATGLAGNEYCISTYKLSTNSDEQMNYNLSAAVNAALVVAAFRPAKAASLSFPNIDMRSLNDVVLPNGLDAETNPPFGQYGYIPSTFYKNSFLQTVGRYNKAGVAAFTPASTLLMMGVG